MAEGTGEPGPSSGERARYVRDEPVEESAPDAVDAAMASWRQGDCALVRKDFGVLTAVESEGQQEEAWGALEFNGLVVVSQSCDIVRAQRDRPYVEVCPLIPVSPDDYSRIEACQTPRYAAIPGVSQHRLVADLDFGMTVEKTVVAKWQRTEGLRDDDERRRFARALARKRARFAFPDDFNPFIRPLQKRLRSKSGARGPEGDAVGALAEIRVLATPDWNSPVVDLTFYFIMNDEAPLTFGLRPVHEIIQEWLGRLSPTSRYGSIAGQATTYVNMTAADYLQSDQLDLDNVSPG